MSNDPVLAPTNVVSFTDYKEGKEPPLQPIGTEPPDDNWLSKLPLRCVFLAKIKPGLFKTLYIEEYHIVFKLPGAVRLRANINEEYEVWVDPVEYSSTRDLIGYATPE